MRWRNSSSPTQMVRLPSAFSSTWYCTGRNVVARWWCGMFHSTPPDIQAPKMLISILGAWISGGVEWNIPHHHRATTFLPVQYQVEENADGSRTIWVGELELRQRIRWAVGYTLRPGKSYLEASLRILNRTPVENSMLCFANVAVS